MITRLTNFSQYGITCYFMSSKIIPYTKCLSEKAYVSDQLRYAVLVPFVQCIFMCCIAGAIFPVNYIVNVVHFPLILPHNIAWSYIPSELHSECSIISINQTLQMLYLKHHVYCRVTFLRAAYFTNGLKKNV